MCWKTNTAARGSCNRFRLWWPATTSRQCVVAKTKGSCSIFCWLARPAAICSQRTCITGWWFGCHEFYFPIHIGLLIIPVDVPIFQRGGPTTNQNMYKSPGHGDMKWSNMGGQRARVVLDMFLLERVVSIFLDLWKLTSWSFMFFPVNWKPRSWWHEQGRVFYDISHEVAHYDKG